MLVAIPAFANSAKTFGISVVASAHHECQADGWQHTGASVDLANALITSHIAGNYASCMSEFWRLPVETEIDLSQGRWPLSRVNPDVVLQWNFSER